MSADTGKFVLKKLTKFEDIVSGKTKEVPESDLCFQNEQFIAQFKYEKAKKEKKRKIKPGIFELCDTAMGVMPKETEFRTNELLDTIDNTSSIIKEARTFFSKLHIYEKLKRTKKRGVLIYSPPGMGKTAAIGKCCKDFIAEDSGTVVLNWPTSEINADAVSKFLSVNSEYDKKCTRMVLIIEDIGGGERENRGHENVVDSGLLNLLDGVNTTFKLPTFIIATTNHPENLLGALANRPGRFDLMMELQPPSHKEKIALLEFIAKRKATDKEKESLDMKGAEKFSIAHIEEVVIRSLLHDKSVPDVVEELIEHFERFDRGFGKDKTMGIRI